VILEYQRFEGHLGSRRHGDRVRHRDYDRHAGTVVDAFGVYSDPALSALLKDVPIRKAD
jgi:hypothetical protein